MLIKAFKYADRVDTIAEALLDLVIRQREYWQHRSVLKPESFPVIKSLIPESIAPPFARYAHGVTVDNCSGVVLTSGQLALHVDGSIPVGAKAQAELCFSNIEAILEEAGTDADHVVKINAYVTDREHMEGYMQARDSWLAKFVTLPASTLMIVAGFTRPEFVVEIEVVAVLP